MIRGKIRHGNRLRARAGQHGALHSYLYLPLLCTLIGACRSEPSPQTKRRAEPTAITKAAVLPKIDVHMHIAPGASQTALQLMREHGIAIGLNASGGFPGEGLEQSIALAAESGGRLLPYCNLRLAGASEPDFARYVEITLDACKASGALGLKISKALGLGVLDAQGRILPVDDPRFDPIFEHAARVGLPVLIHSADPKAFFRAPTPDNERYEELQAHPSWSFYGTTERGEPWPTWQSILESFERRVARHPKTIFVGAHFGNAAEEPERVARMLDSHPNYFIDTAARVPEIGRHSAERMRAFFIAHQDRILFGSDLAVLSEGLILGSGGTKPDPREEAPRFFRAHWRYFETAQRNLATPTPIQGAWTIDGLGLPRSVLERLYFRNAGRVFGLSLPASAQPSESR